MNKIDILADQTKFLYEKQTEVLRFFKSQFESLQNEVKAEQHKAEQEHAGEKLASFQNVSALLESQEGESIKDMEEDVNFVGEQYKAIEQVQSMNDPEKVEELTNMMLEDDHNLTDTKQFKADVVAEGEDAMTNYKMMIDDIKSVLAEEGIKELELLLEAYDEARKQEGEVCSHDEPCEDSSCQDEDSDDECCSSKKKTGDKDASEDDSCEDESCSPSSCSSCPGCDIFEGLEVKSEKSDASGDDESK